jgi:hypothetical protein
VEENRRIVMKNIPLVPEKYSEVRAGIVELLTHTPHELIDFALELSRFIPESVSVTNEETAPRFLAQSDLQSSLFSALRKSISFVPRRITVVGVFFDSELDFLMRLRNVWPLADIAVGVDPSTVYMSRQERKTLPRSSAFLLLPRPSSCS